MIERVLDASAVIAFLLNEAGGQQIGRNLKTSALTSVNLAEVATRLSEANMPADEIAEVVDSLDCDIVAINADVGLYAGLMRAATRHKGLSLGDRICLAFAKLAGLPVYTADRPWADLDIGVDVRLIR